jgi:hypothetical protein
MHPPTEDAEREMKEKYIRKFSMLTNEYGKT